MGWKQMETGCMAYITERSIYSKNNNLIHVDLKYAY
jgi:hypothetical protein